MKIVTFKVTATGSVDDIVELDEHVGCVDAKITGIDVGSDENGPANVYNFTVTFAEPFADDKYAVMLRTEPFDPYFPGGFSDAIVYTRHTDKIEIDEIRESNSATFVLIGR